MEKPEPPKGREIRESGGGGGFTLVFLFAVIVVAVLKGCQL